MTVYIDIITGFLESGKTTFIKEMIKKNVLSEYKKIVLIVCEEGLTQYDSNLLYNNGIEMILVENSSKMNDSFFAHIKKEYQPDYIMVEFNGTWDITSLLNLRLPFTYHIRNVLFLSNAKDFQIYLGNMASVLQPHIRNSDVVLFNRQDELDKKQKKILRQDVRNINSRTKVIFDKKTDTEDIINRYFQPYMKYYKISWGTIVAILFLLIASLLSDNMLMKSYTFVQSMSTIFLSILIEAIPFVLFGAIISTTIQLLIPRGWIMRRLSDRGYRSFLLASIAGFFMPICDCGTVPIVSGLLKKETPFPQTMTFWLASSAVNPIVLISVYYAFPGQPYLVIIRVVIGLLIAILTGIILKISHIETKKAVRDIRGSQNIGGEFLELKYNGLIGRIEAVIKGARFEFFRVIKYLILGALVSSFLLTIIPQAVRGFLSNSMSVQILVMLVAAVFMSTCSTSNAFIGRSFLSSFTIMPIMLYVVLGPMLDFKNMIMLSGIIKKRYLLLVGIIVSLIGDTLFLILSQYIG